MKGKSFLNRIMLLLCLVALLPLVSLAQTVHQLVKAGDQKFSEGDYYAAAQYYEDALKKDEENPELYYKYAESARMFNDYGGAAAGYKAAAKFDKQNQFPLAAFWQGIMLRSVCECKTEEVINVFKKFRNKYKKKDYYAAKAQQEMESANWVLEHLQKTDSIKIEHLGKDINSEKSEFNAIPVFPDKLQFSSLRNISSDKKNEKYLSRIYNQPPNPAPVYMPTGANESLNIGNGAYTPDSRRFYFTECEQKDKTSSRCDIYVTRFENYQWTPAEKLTINDPSFTSTQPYPGKDAAGNELLFFASDRTGGQGSMDIWVSKIKADGTYEAPINAGKNINSQGNEITPFYDANTRQLYFSSDWHYGFGGYDIFSSKGEYQNWSAPQNLLQPINTAQNDLYYVMAPDNSIAYITSNRKGSYFIESETCCNDIYAYRTGKKISKLDTPTVTVVQVDTPKAQPPVVENPVTTGTPTPEPRKFVDETIRRVKQLLPVQLYFHNDEPNAKTLADTTSLDYRQTYEAYSALRGEYEREYPKSVKREEKADAQKQVADLFDKKVDKGYYNLVAFTSQLLDLLQKNNKLEITIKGYCSPLNFNEYNIKLGYRRVASLRNYFYHYRDGILLPYLANGSLVLKNESLGEETAPKNISDNREDKPKSVYSPAAALERRVEIISVELK
ncbi:MAG: hypothetical protein U0V74_00990 [Chitinophagales bacterium]